MDDEQQQTLSRFLGRRLRDDREHVGVTAEQVAAAARDLGLGWHRSTVASIETGARAVRAEELVMLPMLWWFAHIGTPATLGELLADGDEPVQLGPEIATPASMLRDLVERPGGVAPNDIGAPMHRWRHAMARLDPDALEADLRRRAQQAEAVGAAGVTVADIRWARSEVAEAERKAARKFDLDAHLVVLAARARWGRSLTDERDARVAERTEGAPARTVQAVRGHVTRELLAELDPVLRAAASLDEQGD